MKNTYKYSCKVEINDKNTLKELYDYLRYYKYVVDKPYQSVGKYLANILVTVNDKNWLSYYLYWKKYDAYAVLTRSDIIEHRTNVVDCGTDIELFKRLVVIKSEEDDFDFALYNLNKAYEK
jgi:hypothetical protein